MIGVRHDAIMELEHTLAKTPDTMQATLSEPLRNLDPGGDLIEYFDISEPSLIGPEVQRLVELVVLHGPRFARPLGTTSSVISALRDRAHVANVTVAQMRLPVALLIDGQKSEARKAMNDALSETRGSTSADGQVRSFSTAFFAHLMTLGR